MEEGLNEFKHFGLMGDGAYYLKNLAPSSIAV